MDPNRKDFLIAMYNQLFNDINRHILVVWQSIGVVVGAFAVLALIEKNVVSTDVAVAVIFILVCWLVANALDASLWYNRNLVIIANIERQFLASSDLKVIHYYFGKHRPGNRMIQHLRIQVALATSLAIIFVVYHFSLRVFPGFASPWSAFELSRAFPYMVLVGGALYDFKVFRSRKASYQEFLLNSPGMDVDTTGIAYKSGHGFRGKEAA